MQQGSSRIEENKPRLVPSVRFMLALLGFALTAIQYMQRINMSVAIVCMVNNTHLDMLKHSTINPSNLSAESKVSSSLPAGIKLDECPVREGNSSKPIDGPFNWNKQTQGLILSAFFYGYLFTQIAGAWLSLKFGAKIVLEMSILFGSIFTLLTPLAARFNEWVLIACRFAVGFVHGVVWSGMSTFWPNWAPPDERSTILGISSAGSQIGNVITLPLGGFLCEYGFDGGWPSIFYVIGIVGLIWCLLWFVLVSDGPASHRFISHNERDYVSHACSKSKTENKKTPWLDILTSRPVYALVITHACSNFGNYLFLTQLPTYMNEILKFDIKSNGGLSALPYLGFWLFTILSGIASDLIMKKAGLSRTITRKIFNTIGFLVPMLCVIGLIFVTCQDPYVGVVLVTIGLSLSGLTYGSGFLVNYNDIGGTFSGIVFGISNTIGTVSGIIAPYLVGVLTRHKTQQEWQTVFIITAVVYLVGMTAFILIGSGETQDWAKNNNNDNPKEAALNEEELKPLKKV